MFSHKQLSEEQISQVHAWAAEGDQISDIQKRLLSECEISITYMEARFLVLDLNVEIIPEEADKEPEEEKEKVATGEVRVKVDEIIRPGFAVSGNVQFSDGEEAVWGIDQMGSFNLDPDTHGYKPSESDLEIFQNLLRKHFDGQS